MNEYSIESFISYCDDMMIVEEGFLSNLKDRILKGVKRIIEFLRNKVRKMKDSWVKRLFMRMLGLSNEIQKKTKYTDDLTKLKELNKDLSEIQEAVHKACEMDTKAWNDAIKQSEQSLKEAEQLRDQVKSRVASNINNRHQNFKKFMDDTMVNIYGSKEEADRVKKEIDDILNGVEKDLSSSSSDKNIIDVDYKILN